MGIISFQLARLLSRIFRPDGNGKTRGQTTLSTPCWEMGQQANGVNYIRQVEENAGTSAGTGGPRDRPLLVHDAENCRIEKTYRMLVYGEGRKISAQHEQ